MSIAYLIAIETILGGYFRWGRFIDLAQLDLIAGLLLWILIIQVKRWNRLKAQEKKYT